MTFTSPRVALIADDLTGACDAAVKFCNRGARAVVALSESLLPGEADVLAVSTDTRDCSIPEIESRLFSAAARLSHERAQLIFKKIDSTLRGNVGAEILAAFRAFQCELAIITPAFPDMARIVREGSLYFDSSPAGEPIYVAARLRDQGLSNCQHVAPEGLLEAIAAGHVFLSLDAICNDDLGAIVAALSAEKRRILWAGSAGLAAALADGSYARDTSPSKPLQRTSLPVLYCIGSDHPATKLQIAALLDRTEAHSILMLARDTAPEKIRNILKPFAGNVAAVFLCGGDTASLFCRATGAQSIELEGEIVNGVPWGRLNGGLFHQVAVATKSGGFGAADALIRVADFFTCRTS